MATNMTAQEEQVNKEISKMFDRLFGTDPVEGLIRAYSQTPESVGMDAQTYQSVVYMYTKVNLHWIIEAVLGAK